ncbi:CHAP domain-containing protein [Microbispora amethystogenes]|uniref:Peptidase C51 domain-containing protein n=1 Tax=Microbispora amethystogenes TaxID=1427754 RepID=A0ABQ4FKI0_9ACTN|nr:CHAP domain-containing protein [Microbispora amethystogenes]GIH35317.1 hypothetical protein Mam01_54810 [Microbispora amethystogenes]
MDSDFKAAPWCDMFVSWAADRAGVRDHVGEFALTTKHAKWFEQQGAWSRKPEPGAVVFFDWSGSKRIKDIDHVGIVEKVVGGKVHTIEGNVDGVWLKRKVRDSSKIVGYGLPRKVKATPKVTVTVQPVAADATVQGAADAAVQGSAASATRNMAASHGQSPGAVFSPGDAVLPAGLLFALVSTAVTGLRFRAAAAATSGGRHRKGGPRRAGDGGERRGREAAGAGVSGPAAAQEPFHLPYLG